MSKNFKEEVPFNVPPFTGREIEYMKKAIQNRHICGDGEFTKKCQAWLEENLATKKALLTTSGSAALDMAARLCGLKEGDEVILPSYTFSSTANSIILSGASPVFVDIRPDTMNIDENRIEAAVTDKTKAICVVHYAGVACEMDKVMAIARKYGLKVIEDAAQAMMSSYKGRPLGTIGDFGCLSFHETKNYSMGEGGAILINDEKDIVQAEIIREKGTDRSRFFRGEVDKYSWVDVGDSYLPSDILAAYLYAQLEMADEINSCRLRIWNAYYGAFEKYSDRVELPVVPKNCRHNAHIFYLKFRDLEQRQDFIRFAKENGIKCTFHYVPLHSSPAGRKYGRFSGADEYTTKESERLVRLPLYYNMAWNDRVRVILITAEYLEKIHG